MASKEEQQLAEQVWALVVAEGVLAVLFGIVMLFWPGATLLLLIALFGIFVLVWGIVNLIRSILAVGKLSTWWIELIFSILAVGVGVYLLRNPEVTATVFVILIGLTFLVRGLIDFLTAFLVTETVPGSRVLHVLSGVIGIAAAIIVFSQPVASGVAFIWIVGLYTVIQGSLVIAIALRERSLMGK